MSATHEDHRIVLKLKCLGNVPRVTVISRLCQIITKRMTIKEIEFAYIAKWGKVTHRTLLLELSNLKLGGIIKRVKHGVYEP